MIGFAIASPFLFLNRLAPTLVPNKFSKTKSTPKPLKKELNIVTTADEILDKAAEKMAEIFVAQADSENNKQSKNKLIKKI